MAKRIMKIKKLLPSLGLPLTLLLGSCGADFTSVKKFGDTRTEVKQASDNFADDIYESCLRRIRYVNLSGDDGIEIQNDRREGCETNEKKNSQDFKKAMTVLISYMENLSAIAGGEGLSLDESIDNLGTSIKELSIDGQKLDAGAVDDGGIPVLKVLGDIVTKKIREDALQKAIVCANEPLHKYITGNGVPMTDKDGMDMYKPHTGGLMLLVTQGYTERKEISPSGKEEIKGTLAIEKAAIETYYTPYFSALGKLGRDKVTTNENYSQVVDRIVVTESLSDDYNQAMKTVSDKMKAASSFNKILLNTAKTHNQLSKEFGKGLSESDIANLCINYKNTEISFQEIDPEQMQRIQKILQEYLTAIEPLLEEVNEAF